MLNRSHPTRDAVAEDSCRFVVSLSVQEVECVLGAAGSEWLYSGVTKRKPSHAATASAHPAPIEPHWAGGYSAPGGASPGPP